MKIGIFTDSHYSSAEVTCNNRYNSKSLAKIKEAYEYFLKEGCDLVVCLGDLSDKEGDHSKEVENLKKVSAVLKGYNIKTSVVLGNHDAFAFDVDEFYGILGEEYRPENIYKHNQNLIFIDSCYFKNGRHYQKGDSDWKDTYYPKAEELEAILSKAEGDAYIFMHQNIDPSIREDHRLFNDSEIRAILEKSNKVKVVFQGHYHPGFTSCHNDIKYITYPAMCEKENAYYVAEIQ